VKGLPESEASGKYYFLFRLETRQEPLFRLLGTSAEDKKQAQYVTGDAPPPLSDPEGDARLG
jgi:hypothetical protein